MPFETKLTLRGPLRKPRQMLSDQEYGGHASIHDDTTAEKLGFRAGPIEGPTHFSLFPPLLAAHLGQRLVRARLHFRALSKHGGRGRGSARLRRHPAPGRDRDRVWAEKEDGTPVLEASASLGPDDGETLLEARSRPAPARAPA